MNGIGYIPLKDILPGFTHNRWSKKAQAFIRIEVSSYAVQYRYWILCALGAVEFQVHDISPMRKEDDADYDRVTAGIELHWRKPPSGMEDEPPSHATCPMLAGRSSFGPPCWHDGGSTWGQTYVDRWRRRRTEIEVLQWLVPLLTRLEDGDGDNESETKEDTRES